jgi:hypothetical protein
MNDTLYAQIVYFEREGRENLPYVLRVLKKALKKRPELRSLKLVIFTAMGQGPALAYNELSEFDIKIIAVMFPVDFSLKQEDGNKFFPRIPPKVKKFFDGVEIRVLEPAPLPFDSIEGLQARNDQMKAIKSAISLFGGSFALCVQAVLRACDAGALEQGEAAIAMTGDCAALVTASTTAKFLTPEGMSIKEIFCKPRNLTIAKPTALGTVQPTQQVLEGSTTAGLIENKSKELPERTK